MSKKKQDVIFAIECMTTLRYVLPIMKAIKKRKSRTKIRIYARSSNKYNCPLRNIKALNDIIEKRIGKDVQTYVGSMNDYESQEKIECDYLFTVENTPFSRPGRIFKYKKRYCIQHGTDYWHFADKVSDNSTSYIASGELYKKDILENYNANLNILTTKTPLSFWEYENDYVELADEISKKIPHEGKKTVCLFYPETSFHGAVFDVIDTLKSEFFFFIKQRRKNQPIPQKLLSLKSGSCGIYDDMWYPSEAILLPGYCDVSVGFGTSAYIDIVNYGLRYVDWPLHNKTEKYPKPNILDNYMMAESTGDMIEKIRSIVQTPINKNVNSELSKLEFIEKLLS